MHSARHIHCIILIDDGVKCNEIICILILNASRFIANLIRLKRLDDLQLIFLDGKQ